MRDISTKTNTLRIATAQAIIQVSKSLMAKIHVGDFPKGDPFPIAKIAAIQAVKNTSQIIPYCHPMPIDYVSVDFNLTENQIEITVLAKAIYKTGVEMEALTGATVAALTIYDMLKPLDENIEINSVRLLEKKGGKSDWTSEHTEKFKATVLVMSDRITAGKAADRAGTFIVEKLKSLHLQVADYQIIADDPDQIDKHIKDLADHKQVDLIITCGGTGLSARDHTPETIAKLLDKEIPGIVEIARAYGQERTPFAMLSRSCAGLRKKTLIISLPGSLSAVKEYMDALFPAVLHGLDILRNSNHTERVHSKHTIH